MPISPNFNLGAEAANLFRILTVRTTRKYRCAVVARLQRLTTHPWPCDWRKPEAQARQRHTPFWCQRNTAIVLKTLTFSGKSMARLVITHLRFSMLGLLYLVNIRESENGPSCSKPITCFSVMESLD